MLSPKRNRILLFFFSPLSTRRPVLCHFQGWSELFIDVLYWKMVFILCINMYPCTGLKSKETGPFHAPKHFYFMSYQFSHSTSLPIYTLLKKKRWKSNPWIVIRLSNNNLSISPLKDKTDITNRLDNNYHIPESGHRSQISGTQKPSKKKKTSFNCSASFANVFKPSFCL